MRFIFPAVLSFALGLGGCAKSPTGEQPAAPGSETPAASASVSMPVEPASVPAEAAERASAPVVEPAEPASVPAEPAVAPPSTASTPAPPTPKHKPREPRAAAATAVPPAVAPPEAVPAQPGAAPQEATPPEVAKTPEPAAAPAEASPPTQTLDLTSLEQRLRDTRAIGLFTKLSLKNQVDDLLAQFREFYNGRSKMALPDLHQRYDLLLMKVLSLLQNADPPLAADISASRSAIWSILADPKKFAKLQT